MGRVPAERWRERVKAWEASGRTAKTFASSRGFDPRQLQWWKWKFARDGAAPRAPRPAFVPAHVVAEAAPKSHAAIDVTFMSGVVVRVPPGFSARALAELIQAVGALPC